VARPRHGFEALGVDLFAAGDAFSEAAFANARERAFDQVEQLPVVVALAEKEFLGVGTGGSIGDVLGGLFVDQPKGGCGSCVARGEPSKL
jgi:hypothetical protein